MLVSSCQDERRVPSSVTAHYGDSSLIVQYGMLGVDLEAQQIAGPEPRQVES